MCIECDMTSGLLFLVGFIFSPHTMYRQNLDQIKNDEQHMSDDQNKQRGISRDSKQMPVREDAKIQEQDGHFDKHDGQKIADVGHNAILSSKGQRDSLRDQSDHDRQLT